MKLTIQIPDDLYEVYAAHLSKALAGKATIEDLLAHQLERFKEVSPSDRVVVILPPERSRLEALLAGGSILDGRDLAEKVQRLADIQIGEVRVDFSPGELKNIRTFATKNRKPVQQVISDVVHGMKEQFGLYVG